jgi:hypothetical protein
MVDSVAAASDMLQEENDCAVIAVSIVTGVHYIDVHGMFEARGRKPRGSTKNWTIWSVLKRLGFQREKVEVQSRTVRTLGREFRDRPGVYLAWTSGHILAIKDGEIMDWTHGRLHRIIEVEEVSYARTRSCT